MHTNSTSGRVKRRVVKDIVRRAVDGVTVSLGERSAGRWLSTRSTV
jgi:hypothetical protein